MIGNMNLNKVQNLNDIYGGRVSPIGQGLHTFLVNLTALVCGEDYRIAVRSRSPAPHSPDSLTRIGVFHFTPKESVKCVRSVRRAEKRNLVCLQTLDMLRLLSALKSSLIRKIQDLLTLPWSLFKKQTNIIVLSAVVMLIISTNCSTAFADTMNPIMVERIVSAIYKAEGGAKAIKPYGILSVPCNSKEECKRICENTVKNNWKRYNQWGHKQHPTYLAFLASRYAPIGVSNDPTNLNKNWLKNVQYFLYEGGGV